MSPNEDNTAGAVAILMGSKSDLELVRPAVDILRQFDVEHTVRVLSAHRTPERTRQFAETARKAGFKAIICAAGGAAHLAGAVAAHTTLPVIGLPLARTPLAGTDALYATVQMPQGMPVATVAIDGAANAALLAVQILAVSHAKLEERLAAHREQMQQKVAAADGELEDLLRRS